MAAKPDDAGDGAWNPLERNFFETAPPDIPEPAPAPPSFDDLDPIAPAREPARLRLRRARAAAAARLTAIARSAARSAAEVSRRVVVPAIARSWRLSAATGRAAIQQTVRGLGTAATRLAAAFPAERAAKRASIAALAGAVVVVVLGLSAGVVASRNGDPISSRPAPAAAPAAEPTQPAAKVAAVAAGKVATVVALVSARAPTPAATSRSVEPPVVKRSRHRRKPVRHAVTAHHRRR